MKHCKHCDLDVNTSRRTCPLCNGILEDKKDSKEVLLQNYPEAAPKPHTPLIIKICVFLSIIGVIASVLVNWKTFNPEHPNYWSVIATIGILYAWFLFKYIAVGKGPIPERILYSTVFTAIVVIAVEFCVTYLNHTWQKSWSLTFVLPCCLMVGLIAIQILIYINKKYTSDGIICVFYLSIMTVIPHILYLTCHNLVVYEWPPIACVALGAVSLLALSIFKFRALRAEIKKRFHM